MLGDNPMQSEIACHIGLKGKFFCRNCWVKGADVSDRVAEVARLPAAHEDCSEADISAESDASLKSTASNQSQNPMGPKKKQRQKETMQEMVDRAQRFLGVIFSSSSECMKLILLLYTAK